jgi:hypothetical protein
MGFVRGLGQDDFQGTVFTQNRARLFGVNQAIEGRELLARDALTGVEHRIEGLAAVLGMALTLGEDIHPQPVVKKEVQRGSQ